MSWTFFFFVYYVCLEARSCFRTRWGKADWMPPRPSVYVYGGVCVPVCRPFRVSNSRGEAEAYRDIVLHAVYRQVYKIEHAKAGGDEFTHIHTQRERESRGKR
ncbi:hypothetical protein LZ30DRAFT_270410 [Colletotrichum cereale]|nr:hypothetical protein LZ30DRAFT_270410 [Colletotrichum cereale]